MSYYIAPLAPQMAPLRCRGIIVFVGALYGYWDLSVELVWDLLRE
jgi:hypothetical protein